MVAAPASRCSSADASAPSGCVPLTGCASCCGSPSSTRLCAAPDTASTFASDICPASSTTRTSSCSCMPLRANNHAVPATTSTSPASSAASTSLASPVQATSGLAHRSLCSAFCSARNGWPLSRATLHTSSSRLPITLWLKPQIPTRLPCATRRSTIRAPAYVLPVPGGPCTGSTPASSSVAHRATAAVTDSPAAPSRPPATRGGRRSSRSRAALRPGFSDVTPCSSTSRARSRRRDRCSRSSSGLPGTRDGASGAGLAFPRLTTSQPSSGETSVTVPTGF